MLHQQIKDGIKDAMKSKDEIRLTVLRGLVTDFTNELVAKMRKPTEMLSDDDAMTVIKRAAKRRKDSIEQFMKGNRKDLADSEESELKIIDTFIPAMMGKDEIRTFVLTKKQELGITDKTKVGQLIGTVMKDLKNKADGNLVKEVVEESFS
ncbi:MAG: GatB/YqeY domain-containing protein [Candidatus Paceibacterota bacterium]|jgi:hypothetical protein